MRLGFLSLVAFLSGISALLFQTLWLRLSGLVFGNSVWSAALILSSFMGGLAIGGALAAWWKKQPARPLRFYALLEAAVAICGCALVFILPSLGEWLRPFFQMIWSHDLLLNTCRFVFAFVLLLVPTTAMGMTLPVLVAMPNVSANSFQRVISLLYGANTLGAVAGAIAGEAFLIGAFGLLGTALIAGGVNLLAATLALLLSRSATEIQPAKGADLIPSARRARWHLLILSFGVGGIFLCLEVVWFRFLRLYVASSATAFSIMLAIVLSGIGLGGLTASVFKRDLLRRRGMLPLLLMAAAIVTLLSYILFPIPPPSQQIGASYIESWREIGILSAALMFPAAFVSGILFPLMVDRVEAATTNRMNSTGLTTLFNTIGAAAGPLVATFFLLPAVGFQWSLIICAACYALLGLFAWLETRSPFRRASNLILSGAFLSVVALLICFPYQRDAQHFARARQPYEVDGSHLVAKIEGNSDTLQLLRRDYLGEPYYYRLVTNAYSMSGTLPRSQRYMRTLAYLPLAFCPEAKNALLICYGVGVTADALVRDTELEHVDVVDISKEIMGLSAAYHALNFSDPLSNPRVTTFVQDGRFFLQASPRRYDVITGEPPPLKTAGTVNLYTEEFFRLMKSRLNENGAACFWLPIYQLRVGETKAILHAFRNVFPDCSVWAGSDFEWMMLGINGSPRKIPATSIGRLWNIASTATDLMRIGVENPEQLGGMFVMDAAEIDRITFGSRPLQDLFPKRLSDEPPNLKETYAFAAPYMDGAMALRHFRASTFTEREWPNELTSSLEIMFLVRGTRFRSQLTGSNWLAELDFYLRHSQLRTPVMEVLNSDEFQLAIVRDVLSKSGNLTAEAMTDLIASALAKRDFEGAISLLEQQRQSGTLDLNRLLLLIYLYCLDGKTSQAEALAGSVLNSIPDDWFVQWTWKQLQSEFGFLPPQK